MSNTSPKLISLSTAAAYVGISRRMLANGIRARDIPVTVRTIGRNRQQFVSASELEAWVANKPVDLFATEESA